MLILLTIVLAALAGATGAWSQQTGYITLEAVAEQEREVINDKGEKELERFPAAKVIPGDEVIYSVHYTHTGTAPADNVVITNPVPENMLYTPASASGVDTVISFSVDNGKTYDLPEKLTVTAADGSQRPARASDYTHIKWAFQKSMSPGQKGQVSFRARLQ